MMTDDQHLNEDLVYAGRDRKRPPGASDFTQQLYRLLHEHPGGMTLDEIHEAVCGGWMETDAYRAYARDLDEKRARRRNQGGQHNPSAGHLDAAQRRRLEYGSDLFKERAQRWWISKALTHMRKADTARRDGDRWFVGHRAPRVRAQRGTYALFDPAESRAVLTTTTREHVRREQVKAQLLAGLNDKRIRGRSRELIQLAYDHLSGR